MTLNENEFEELEETHSEDRVYEKYNTAYDNIPKVYEAGRALENTAISEAIIAVGVTPTGIWKDDVNKVYQKGSDAEYEKLQDALIDAGVEPSGDVAEDIKGLSTAGVLEFVRGKTLWNSLFSYGSGDTIVPLLTYDVSVGVTDYTDAFYNSNIADFPQFDYSAAKSIKTAFAHLKTNSDLVIDAPNVTDISQCCYHCTAPKVILKNAEKIKFLASAFYQYKGKIVEIENINNLTVISDAFRASEIEHIKTLYMSNITSIGNAFYNAHHIKTVVFTGTINVTLKMQYSPNLLVETMQNAIECLANYAGTDKEFTCTISFHNDAWDRLEASGTAPNGDTWKNYVNSKGWNYSGG